MPNFDSLRDFIRFLPGLAVRVEAAQQRGREAAVEVVRREVVGTLGDYQREDTGPFPSWAELADETKEAREKHGFEPNEPEFVTGALLDSISAAVERDGRAAVGVPDEWVGDGSPGDQVRNIGDVAVDQELGTGSLPQRSFLGVGAYRASERAAEAFVLPVIDALSGKRPSRGSKAAPHGND